MNRIVKHITEGVAQRHGVTVDEILGRTLRYKVAHARHEAFYMVRQFDPDFYSYPLIGAQFQRDHSTIIMGIRSHLRREAKSEPQQRKAA